MTTPVSTAALLAQARLDPTLRTMVADLMDCRWGLDAQAYELLLWLLAANAATQGRLLEIRSRRCDA